MAQDARSAQKANGWAPWHDAWQMVTGALPLLLVWLSFPAFLLVLIVGLQSAEPVVRRVRSPAVAHSLTFADAGITLIVSIPREITSDPQMTLSQVVSVRASVAARQSMSDTVLIAVEAPDGRLALTDDQGRPFPQPAAWIVPVGQSASPVCFYVHPQPAFLKQTASLQFRVSSELGDGGWSDAQPLPVAVEAGWQTWLFRAAGSQSGLTALASALLAALVGFGVQQWVKLEEENRERQRRREEALTEVSSLRVLLQHEQFDAAMERYKDLCSRQQRPWEEETVRKALEKAWEEQAPRELQMWARIGDASEGETSPEAKEEKVRAALWAFKHLRSAAEEAPTKIVQFLESDEGMVAIYLKVLTTTVDGLRLLRQCPDLTGRLGQLEHSTNDKVKEAARALRRIIEKKPGLEFLPWPGERPADPPEVANGIKALGLRLNPLGPERAELDPLLKEYGVRPSRLWDRIRGARSVAVFGPPGSGKTALALLLAYDCGDPPANPQEKGAFPVYNAFRPGGAEGQGRPALDWVARGVAEALLQVVAGKPHGFAALDPVGQAACAFLWCYSLGAASPEDLIPHFQRAGAPDVPALLESVQAVMGSARLGSQPDETTLLDLLGKARPTGYARTYVLVDLETEPGRGWAQPTLDLVQSLLGYAIYLAMRKVYVKLFLPERFRHFLGDDLPIEVVHLEWEREDLAEMLKSRLVHIGLSSLAQVYSDPGDICPDPDGRLVEAAKGSPRRLVRLGNEMLARVQTARLKLEHLPRE